MLEILFNFDQMKFFSVFGLAVVILSLLPNFVFAKKKHLGKTDDIDTCGAGVCLLQLVSGFLMNTALICVRMPEQVVVFGIIAAVLLVLYYCVWIGYFKNGCYYPDLYLCRFIGIPIPMTTFKVMYFVFAAIWLGNGIALILAMVCGVCEIMNAVKAEKDLKTRRYV